MEKSDFIDVSTPGWWLLELQLYNDKLEELRAELGEPRRWEWTGAKDKQWFTKPDNLTDIFVFLQSRSALMTDLDALLEKEETAGPDATKRQAWLEDLLEAKPVLEEEEEEAEEAGDKAAGSPQGKVPGPPATPPAPAKVSAFGPKADAAPAAKAEEPVKKQGLFDQAKAKQAEPAPTAGGAPAPAAAADAQPVPPAATPPPPSKAEVEALGENPQAMISKEEVAELLDDPDFEAKLKAAMEKLDAELAAAESEE